MEDTYGEDAEYQDDSSLCHLQKRPALHMGGKRDDDQRSGVKEKGSRKRGGLLFIVLLTICGAWLSVYFFKKPCNTVTSPFYFV